MEGIFLAGEVAIDEVTLSVTKSSDGQRHIGIIYRDPESDAFVTLHLAFHLELKRQIPRYDGVWAKPAIPDARLRQVAMICRNIWNKNRSAIPFGVSVPNDCFNAETFEFLVGST